MIVCTFVGKFFYGCIWQIRIYSCSDILPKPLNHCSLCILRSGLQLPAFRQEIITFTYANEIISRNLGLGSKVIILNWLLLSNYRGGGGGVEEKEQTYLGFHSPSISAILRSRHHKVWVDFTWLIVESDSNCFYYLWGCFSWRVASLITSNSSTIMPFSSRVSKMNYPYLTVNKTLSFLEHDIDKKLNLRQEFGS